MRLKTLRPRISPAPLTRVRIAQDNPDATPRLRGPQGVKRRAAWLRAQPLCVHCQRLGFVTVADEVDHIVPLHHGGADDESNLQSLCQPCHARKTASEAGARAARARGW